MLTGSKIFRMLSTAWCDQECSPANGEPIWNALVNGAGG